MTASGDTIEASWLAHQHAEGMALASESDILALDGEPGPFPPRRYLARFRAPTLAKTRSGIERVEGFVVAFQFVPGYLRVIPDATQVVALVAPGNAFHPNVAAPFLCIGRIVPGTGLRELIYRTHEILTFRKLTPREDDALDHEACVWARAHMHRFPLDSRPLRRRTVELSVTEITAEDKA